MTDTDSALTVTLKSGPGYDDSWLVVRGDNPDQVTNMLRNLGELPSAIVETANLLQAANKLAPVVANYAEPAAAPPPAFSQPQAPAAPQAPQWGAPQQQQQQQFAPPANTGGPQPGQPHPAGQACSTCGALLTYWETKTGKGQFKCPQYRYSTQTKSGNGHTIEWL